MPGRDFRVNFPHTVVLGLSIGQIIACLYMIIVGIISAMMPIDGMWLIAPGGAMFLLSGSLGIAASVHKQDGLIIATCITCILSGLYGIFLCVWIIFLITHPYCSISWSVCSLIRWLSGFMTLVGMGCAKYVTFASSHIVFCELCLGNKPRPPSQRGDRVVASSTVSQDPALMEAPPPYSKTPPIGHTKIIHQRWDKLESPV